MPCRRFVVLALGCFAAACDSRQRSPGCGIAAFAGPSILLEEFTRPGRTLASVTQRLPEVLPVRRAAAGAYRGIVGRSDSTLIIGVDGPLPETPAPGYAVLVVDPQHGPAGVLLYDGKPIPGAPVLGTVNAGKLNVPLIAVRATVSAFEDARCPLFPDSLRR